MNVSWHHIWMCRASQSTRGKSPLFAVRMIHATCGSFTSDTDESRHVLLGHVIYDCVVTSHMNVSCIAADARQVVLVCCANESCHTWMNQSICKWVTSHMNAPCHKWSGRITYERVMSRMKESRHVRMCDVTCECAMSRCRHMASRPWLLRKWFMSRMNESRHIWMCHVTHECVVSPMTESCHIWMSRVTCDCIMSHMAVLCHMKFIYECVRSRGSFCKRDL